MPPTSHPNVPTVTNPQNEKDVTCLACGQLAYKRDGRLVHRDSSLDPSPVVAQGHRVIPPGLTSNEEAERG